MSVAKAVHFSTGDGDQHFALVIDGDPETGQNLDLAVLGERGGWSIKRDVPSGSLRDKDGDFVTKANVDSYVVD